MQRATNGVNKLLKKGLVRITVDHDEFTEKLKANGYDDEQITKVFEVLNEVSERVD